MTGYTAGSVTARIELNTSGFDTKIKELQGKVDALKTQLQNTGLMDVNKEIKRLQEQLKTQSKTIDDYKSKLKSLREGNKNLNKSIQDTVKTHENNAKTIKTETKTLDSYVKKQQEQVKANEQVTKSLKQQETQAKKTSRAFFQKQNGELKRAYRQFDQYDVDFMADVYSRAKVAKNAGKNKISARSIMELPTMREILNLRYPEEGYFGSKNIPSIESLDTDLYKEWKKETQTRMRNLLDHMDLSMSKDRFGDTSSLKVWNEAKGIFETLGTIDISKMSDFGSVAEFRKELENTVNITKVLKEQQARYDAELENSTQDATKLNAEVSKLGSNKGVDEVTIDVKKLGEAEVKTTKETAKLSNELSKIKQRTGQLNNKNTSFKSIENNVASTRKLANETKKTSEIIAESTRKNIQNKTKEAKATAQVNQEQRKAALEAKRNARIYDNMTVGAFKYIDGLKRGLRRNGVNGTDTALWTQFIGQKERTRTFDLDRYFDHMRKTFAGAIPDDLFNEMFTKLNNQFQIGKVGWIGDRGGINESYLKRLRLQAHSLEIDQRHRRRKPSKLDEYLGLDGIHNQLWESNIEKAGKALTTFERGLKTTAIDWNKLNQSAKQFKQYSNNWELTTDQIKRANTALFQFDRMNKGLLGRHKLETGLPTKEVDYERLLNKASVKLNTLPKLEQAGFEAGKQVLQEYLKVWSEAPIVVNRSVNEINSAMSKFVDLNKRGGYKPLGWDKFKQYSNNWELTAQQMEKGTKGFTTLERRLKSTEISVAGFSKIYSELGTAMGSGNHYIQNTLNSFRNLGNGVDIQKAKLKAFADQTKATFESMQVELAKANAATYKYWKQVRGTADVKGYNQLGTLDVGINQYYGQIDKINAKLAEFKVQQQSVNNNVNQTYSAFEKASQGVALFNKEINKITATQQKNSASNTRLSQGLARLRTQMSSFSGSSELAKKAFAGQTTYATILNNRLKVLTAQFNKGKIDINQYSTGLNQLEKEYSQLHTKIQQTTRDLQQGNLMLDKNGKVVNRNSVEYKKMSNGMTGAAHSGRILSNTLYQMRGALLSLKMIFTAMGGMALWGFATDLATGVTETFKAKNEMEAQLRQNKHVDRGGIEYFNNQLDELTKNFKKINKYSIGETVSSIGLEFDLNAKQMADSLDIVSMIQSEYVRAGRKEDEAALAVKDILQGEFQRLSRETGVGKEELKAYGWNGQKTDVESLLKALRKAALDRHWDVFARKATSLNDVMTITKSRFSEAGADLMQSATPMIVGAFNTIIESIDSLEKAFGSMTPFWQNFTLIGGGTAVFGGLLTALPMVTKNMGLAEIATIGWRKSIATAALNLNKAEVAQYGFRKALAATISGTKASELTNIRASKAIFGRLLGVKQSVLAEHGYMTALVQSRGVLKNHTGATNIAKISSMGLAQKLAYLTNNMKLQEAQAMGTGKAILKTATSWRVLRTAILGVMGIALIAWFASVSDWCKTTKDNIDGFHKVVSSGDDLLKDAKKSVEDYTTSIANLKKGTDAYKRATANKGIAEGTVKDLEKANKLAKEYDYNIKQYGASIVDRKKSRKVESYKLAGLDYSKATEKASGYADQVEAGYKAELQAYQVEDKRLYLASQHVNERLGLMKQEKVALKDRLKYAREYYSAADLAAEHWKQFYKGNVTAALYAMGDELKLVWIDLWNNESFVKFWKSVQKTWEELKPTAYAIKDALIGIGEALLNFFSTDQGRWIGTIGLIGTGIGAIGLKIGKWVTGSKSVFEVLKKVGGKLKDVALGWKKVKDNAEDAIDKTGGSTSTGGIAGDTGKTGSTSLGTDLKNIGKNRAKSFANNALILAEGMALVTEAIILIQAPMRALSWVGSDFKKMEPDIRSGIEGLQLIAPVVGAILVPVLILHQVLSKYGKFMSSWDDLKGNLKAFATMMLGIAEGMVLVTEAIGLLILPMYALSGLGVIKSQLGDSVNKGIEAIKITTDALYALVPWIPVFLAGIALAATIFLAPEIALPALATAAIGIATGMALVTEAILTLHMPLTAIESLGARYPNLDGVIRGSEAIKAASEALKYVSDAMGYLTLVDLNLLAQNILDVVSSFLGTDLTGNLSKLTEENGVLDQLSSFVTKFNSDEFTIETINQDKVTALSTAGDGIQTVGDAMSKVKTAMDNLPDEFKQGGTGNGTPVMTYDAKTDTTSVNTGDVGGYFDKFKEPLRQLKSFVYDFNHSEEFNIEQIDPDRVANISSAASMIETVNTAVEKVKTTMQNIGGSGHETAFAQGGALSALGYDLFHMTGAEAINNGQSSGEYKSSLGSQLKEMENVVSDIFTFQSNISSMGGSGGENTNVDGATAMVTTIQTAISNLAQSLSDAVPTFEGKGNAISSALVNGVKKGLDGLGTGISGKVATAIDKAKPTAETYGKGLGWKVQNGFKTSLKIATTLSTEVDNALKAIDDSKKQEFYDKGNGLGSAFATGFKDGAGIHSPGYAAQAMQSEVGYIGQYITDGINNLPNLAIQLANSVSSNFNPSLSLGNFELPNISQFQQGITTITNMANNAKTQVSTKFNEMKTNIGTSFTNIKTNVGTSFSTILTNTRTSLNSMKSATIKNIGNIKTSWRGMQTALINSAENIKTQTGQKISKLKTNLGEFWNKIKHPDQLISGAAGGHTGTIKRRFTGGRANMHYAGGTISRSQSLFKSVRSKGQPSDNSMLDYLKCMMDTGKPCYAGGWNFNWTNKISKKFKGWNTHFGAYHLDDFLNVGKFENSNFPVKHRADVAKQYIFDVISSTDYDKYFDSNFGDDPVAALRAGAFNCWDGTNIVLAIARAFGFNGDRGHGTWNGIGHVWANIPGLGIIDPTAIQNNGSFTSSAVKGYSAGSMPRRYASRNTDVPNNKVVNNTTEVHIHGNVYGVDDLDKAIENGVNKAQRKLFRNSLSGV